MSDEALRNLERLAEQDETLYPALQHAYIRNGVWQAVDYKGLGWLNTPADFDVADGLGFPYYVGILRIVAGRGFSFFTTNARGSACWTAWQEYGRPFVLAGGYPPIGEKEFLIDCHRDSPGVWVCVVYSQQTVYYFDNSYLRRNPDDHIRRLERDASLPLTHRNYLVHNAKKRAGQPMHWREFDWVPDTYMAGGETDFPVPSIWPVFGRQEISEYIFPNNIKVIKKVSRRGSPPSDRNLWLMYQVYRDGELQNRKMLATLNSTTHIYRWEIVVLGSFLQPYLPMFDTCLAAIDQWLEDNLDDFDRVLMFSVMEHFYGR